MADKIKFALALLLVAAGVAGFYFLGDDTALIFRVLSVVGGVIAGALVAWFTAAGQRFYGFSRESINESKKVVWPTRKETLQTTGVVFAFVVAMALFLWLTDKGLEVVLYDFVLGWKKL